jgi:amidase
VRAAVHHAAERLAAAGARIAHDSPLLPDPAKLVDSYGRTVMTFASRGQPGPVISAHEWMDLLDEQARVRRRCRQLFETVDVVLCPPFGTAAYAHQDDQQVLRIDGQDTPYEAQGAWASLASFAGLPATVVPVARSEAGLPIGVQIVGPFLHDRTTLAVADWLQTPR